MRRSRCYFALFLFCVLFCLGCGDSGSFELHWTIGCGDTADPKTCEPRSVKGCSKFGLDSVELIAKVGGEEDRVIFACYMDPEGPVGYGPDLPAGAVTIDVYGLSPSGKRISPPKNKDGKQIPKTVQTSIPETGWVTVRVDLPEPLQCADGIDNDGDGLVDLMDPECENDPNYESTKKSDQ